MEIEAKKELEFKREVEVERDLVVKVRAMGGRCLKLTSPGTAGVPDRIILMPGGRAAFAEVKAPGKKPRPLQVAEQAKLSALGFTVFPCVDGPAAISEVLEWCARP